MKNVIDNDNNDGNDQPCFHGHEQAQQRLPVGSTSQAR